MAKRKEQRYENKGRPRGNIMEECGKMTQV